MLNGRDREDEIKRGIAKRQPARVAAHEADAVRLLAVARTREQGRRNIDARVGLRASQIASIPPSPAADLQNVPRSSFIEYGANLCFVGLERLPFHPAGPTSFPETLRIVAIGRGG